MWPKKSLGSKSLGSSLSLPHQILHIQLRVWINSMTQLPLITNTTQFFTIHTNVKPSSTRVFLNMIIFLSSTNNWLAACCSCSVKSNQVSTWRLGIIKVWPSVTGKPSRMTRNNSDSATTLLCGNWQKTHDELSNPFLPVQQIKRNRLNPFSNTAALSVSYSSLTAWFTSVNGEKLVTGFEWRATR